MSKIIGNIFLFFFYALTLIKSSTCQKRIYFHKSGVNEYKEIPTIKKEIPLREKEPNHKFEFYYTERTNNRKIAETTNIIKTILNKKYLKLFKINSFTRKLEQISTSQENQISTTLENQIFTSQINQIQTMQENQIFTSQVDNIPTTQLNQIPSSQVNQIPTTQVNNMPTTQMTQIQTTQLNNIPDTQFDNIFTTQINNIFTTQLNNIPTTQINEIPTTQTNQIPTTTQLNQIPTTEIKKISTTVINIKTTEIVTNNPTIPKPLPSTQIYKPDPISTTTIINEPPKVAEKIFFLLQAQKIDMKLLIFLIINFPITTRTTFIFSVTKYKSRNLRNLEENYINEEIILHPKKDYEGKYDQVVSLVSDQNITENRIVINSLKSIDGEEGIKVNIANGNSDFLDTQKVQEAIENGKIANFSKIAENGNYTFSQYKINSSSGGCLFFLNSETKINQANKNIELNFIDTENKKNITTNCILSSNNNYIIFCTLNNGINGNYTLEPYSYFDEEEAIIILQNDTNNFLSLQCLSKPEETTEIDSTQKVIETETPIETPIEIDDNSKKGNGLSPSTIAGIIIGIILIIITVIVAVVVYKKMKLKSKQEHKKNDSYTFVPKFYEYPSTASNINI